MSGLFRSEDMEYVRITTSVDAISDVVFALGRKAIFHVVDLNQHLDANVAHAAAVAAKQQQAAAAAAASSGAAAAAAIQVEVKGGDRQMEDEQKSVMFYKKRVVDCMTVERKLAFLEQKMNEFNVPIPFLDPETPHTLPVDVLTSARSYVEPIEAIMAQHLDFRRLTAAQFSSLQENIHVLSTYNQLVDSLQGQVAKQQQQDDLKQPMLQIEDPAAPSAGFHNNIVGSIPRDQEGLFMRMLYRVSRGNAFVRFLPFSEAVLDPQSHAPIQKSVFCVVYIGSRLESRIKKMLSFFKAVEFIVPNSSAIVQTEIQRLRLDLNEKKEALRQTEEQLRSLLQSVANSANPLEPNIHSPLRFWQLCLFEERVVCLTLKKCRTRRSLVVMEGWCPTKKLQEVRETINIVTKKGLQQPFMETVRTKEEKPTYFELSPFTDTFQSIVNTYGIPRYKEANPGLFTIVSFPFLFGVMYGDIGHGAALTLFAFYLLWNEKKMLEQVRQKTMDEILGIVFSGRYLLFGMGLFATYTGTIYNDCASISIRAFTSGWDWGSAEHIAQVTAVNGTLYANSVGVYPFGIDYAWADSSNALQFLNSFKMKLSIIIGVSHMVFGICLSFTNFVYNGDLVSVVFQFIPQVTFMLCTFGYMVFLIIFKWCVDWEGIGRVHTAPNLIQTMIDMFQMKTVEVDENLYDRDLQNQVQTYLLYAALIAVPLMWFPKPIIKYYQGKAKEQHSQHAADQIPMIAQDEMKGQAEEHSGGGGGGGGHGKSHSFGDMMIDQSIHTIEFILGAISNTASYLRLWALSLAHAELAEVFWQKIMIDYGISSNSYFMFFICFGAWFGVTLGVLLMMDVLECFLHALRLHWVEFQNKFYYGDGVPFEALSFKPEQA